MKPGDFIINTNETGFCYKSKILSIDLVSVEVVDYSMFNIVEMGVYHFKNRSAADSHTWIIDNITIHDVVPDIFRLETLPEVYPDLLI